MPVAKTIIFCADGTWNGPEDASGESVLDGGDIANDLNATSLTNVVKFFANVAGTTTAESLALKNESEKLLMDSSGKVVQVAKYLHGVGDSTNPFDKVLGGVFGVGIISRIVRGFTFLSRYYEPGDFIHICGFSRGAYTARALGGVIAQVGLLDPKTYDSNAKIQAYRLGVAAWAKAKTIQLNGKSKLTDVAKDLIAGVEELLATSLKPDNLIPNVPLSSICVWDTVGSLGIPEYVKGARADLFRFVDTGLSNKVALGFHAMALDEQRCDFPVTKWDARAGITQMWFVGAHSDVGGGYAPSESRLSDTALQWMTTNLAGQGIRLVAPMSYLPDISNAISQSIHTPWTKPPYDLLGCARRIVDATDQIHPSVKERWQSDGGYRPGPLQDIWS
jgi:uncharacterized protein (DUF2235 family)